MGAYRSQPETTKTTDTEEKSFCKVGSSSMCGWRTSQEDSHVVHLDENRTIFAVFDGHGGASVSAYAGEHLIRVADEFALGPEAEDKLFQEFVIKLDAEIKNSDIPSDDAGATSVISFMFPVPSDGDGKKKYCFKVCNSGDSRCVCTASGEILATKDHKPMDTDERNRVMAAGGHVANNRVMGDLALSRALGDYRYKRGNCAPEDQIITCYPDIYTWYLKEGDKFCLACDGIFDVKENDELVEFINSNIDIAEVNNDLGKLCEILMDDCICEDPMLSSGCGADNMSVIIGEIKAQSKEEN